MSKQKALEEKKAAKKQSTSAKATKETVQLDLPIENSSEKLERLKQKKDRVSARAKALIYNGPGYAYKYWDYKTQTYGIKSDIWAAKAAGCGVYTPIWVWYKDGKIDHILNPDEIARYTP